MSAAPTLERPHWRFWGRPSESVPRRCATSPLILRGARAPRGSAQNHFHQGDGMRRSTPALCVVFLLSASAARADGHSPAPTQPALSSTPRIASPSGQVYSLGLPSPQRPAINAQRSPFASHSSQTEPRAGAGAVVPQDMSATGWTGYGFGGVPTYQWGYFGARYRPVKIYHQGYYGHQMSFGYRRGY